MKKTSYVFLLFCLILLQIQAFAQVPAPKNAGYEGPNRMNTWAIQLTPAITQFYGDLRQFDFGKGPEEHFTGGLGVGIHKQITPVFGMSTNFWAGKLNGSKSRIYNAHFESGFLQASINAHVNVKPILFGYNKLKRWKWNLHAGYGYMWFNTVVYRLGSNKGIELIRSNTKASSKTAAIENSETVFIGSERYYMFVVYNFRQLNITNPKTGDTTKISDKKQIRIGLTTNMPGLQ